MYKPDHKQDRVLQNLKARTAGPPPATELVFDPRTGELIVKKTHDPLPSPDATTVDQIADDGFFK